MRFIIKLHKMKKTDYKLNWAFGVYKGFFKPRFLKPNSTALVSSRSGQAGSKLLYSGT